MISLTVTEILLSALLSIIALMAGGSLLLVVVLWFDYQRYKRHAGQ